MIHATFIMEQHLGHQVLYQNLRRCIDEDPRVCAAWVPVTYTGERFWERFPFLPATVRGSLTGRSQVLRGMKISPCDIHYFNTQVPAVLHYPKAKGRPYLIATDITPIQYDQMAAEYGHQPDRRGPVRWAKHRANTQVLEGAEVLLPWSAWAGESLINDYGIDPSRVEVMPVGVDLDWWKLEERNQHPQVRILFVGGDFKRKGGDLLLDAFRLLPKGSSELTVVTRSAVSPEEGVTIRDNIRPNSIELRTLYQSSDIFVLPSNAEAFGISAVEACAAGLPVIATHSGGLCDIVDDQVTGFLIPVGDGRALASRLQLLVDHRERRREMGQAAYRRAQMKFDAKKIADRLVDLMVEIISRRE